MGQPIKPGLTFLNVQNSMRYRGRSKFSTRNKAHQGTEAPSRGSTYKVHARQGGFESLVEYGKTANAFDFFHNLRRKKRVASDVDLESGSEKHVIKVGLRTVVQLHADAFSLGTSLNDKSPRINRHIRCARLYPA